MRCAANMKRQQPAAGRRKDDARSLRPTILCDTVVMPMRIASYFFPSGAKPTLETPETSSPSTFFGPRQHSSTDAIELLNVPYCCCKHCSLLFRANCQRVASRPG